MMVHSVITSHSPSFVASNSQHLRLTIPWPILPPQPLPAFFGSRFTHNATWSSVSWEWTVPRRAFIGTTQIPQNIPSLNAKPGIASSFADTTCIERATPNWTKLPDVEM
jgi:hypothetical protein